MAYNLGWKDILRPIRDGYRHLFPSPDTGPTPEEREKQRQLDCIKGFAYLDTFEQLEQWSAADSDPIQRSNTPLLLRQDSLKNGKGQAGVLLCHDYSGNYHEYESAQGAGVDEESYTCEYLQYVETFVYFSHKLVCIPPPTWTNTLHRNGIKSLGTFLIEPQTKGAAKLLQRDYGAKSGNVGMVFPLAKKLADIAHHYGFDGWLVNIEKPFVQDVWDSVSLEAFLRQLKADLGPAGQLTWYDAITKANKISYQNALTPQNLQFSTASGSLLTNYSWKETGARSSKQVAQEHGFPLRNVIFGVDVWAQNTTKLTHPRVTYPENNGGGTNTGFAVCKLAEVGLSVGIFAPAWTFEHFPGHGRTIEQVTWDGIELPEGIECSCGNTSIQHPPNLGSPITHSATKYPVGSEAFFYTDFSRGFGVHDEKLAERIYGGKKIHSQLGSQAVLPSISRTSREDTRYGNSSNELSLRLEDLPGRTQLVVEAKGSAHDDGVIRVMNEQWLSFFDFDMPADASLQLTIVCRYTLRQHGMTVHLYQQFRHSRTLVPIEAIDGDQKIECIVALDHTSRGERLHNVGIHVQGTGFQGVTRVLEVLSISIVPVAGLQSSVSRINGLRVDIRESGDTKHTRLCWEVQLASSQNRSDGLPYSEITGPFSHFSIYLGDLLVGNAFALEYVLRQALVDTLAGDEGVKVTVIGIGFDGVRLAECTSAISI